MRKKTKALDNIDCEIIRLLQKDGRISNTDMAKQIDISEATVRTRLNRLIKNEIIQIVAVSNPLRLGFKIIGHLRIHVDASKVEYAAAQLKKIKSLWFIVITTGGITGVDAEFAVKSMDDLNELILTDINSIEGVTKVESTLTLDFVKRRYDWGTALDSDNGA